MKIAVTTSDGFNVNERFGNGSFYIFKLGAGAVNFVETRNVRISREQEKSVSSMEALNVVYDLIKDCKALYTAQIEKYSVDWFKQMGITPIVYQGEINNLSIN